MQDRGHVFDRRNPAPHPEVDRKITENRKEVERKSNHPIFAALSELRTVKMGLRDATTAPADRLDSMTTSQMRNMAIAAALATTLSLLMAVPDIGGVSTWKIVLAGVGLLLFILGGRHKAH